MKIELFTCAVPSEVRTGNPPDESEVLVIFRVLRAGYRVDLLRLVHIRFV